MLKLKRYLKPFFPMIILTFALLLVQAVCELNLPNLMSDIVNIGIQQGRTDTILSTGLKMLAVALLGVIATVIVGLLASRIAAGAAKTLRRDIFSKVESFSHAEFDKFGAASLITRTTNDITQLQMVLMMGLRMACMAPIMAVGGIIMALGKSLSMGWIIVLACIVLTGIIMVVFSLAMPRFRIIQKLVDKLARISRENLTGLMVIRAFGTQEHEKNRFDAANRELMEVNLFINRVMVMMMPVMMLIMNGTSLLIIWVGAHQIAASSMQVGDMMAFMQYAMLIIMSFLMMAMMFVMLPRAAVSAARAAEVLETPLSICDPEKPVAFDVSKRGIVEFKGVGFRYGNAEENVLSDISFTACPGQTTAFIGSTGSGKSTLINLIPRFYDVTEGQVIVSGRDVREVSQHDLRGEIGYVPQKGVLLSGTIESNLRYGRKDASDEEIRLCSEIAQALDFIDENEEGFSRVISEGGANISGGQKQRLSIARALVKKTPVYIFDDSFSAVDYKTDAALRRALAPYTRDAAVLIVAQRVNTIKNADQIIVLEHGRIVGRGTHKELLSSCDVYAEIAGSQLSEEELA